MSLIASELGSHPTIAAGEPSDGGRHGGSSEACIERRCGAALPGRYSIRARGFRWRERLDSATAKTAAAISQRHGLPELLGRVLASRHVAVDEVPDVLEPTIKALMPDPSTLRDMDKGAARFADAIVRKEAIAVFGDYDVDGACSAALIKRFASAHGLDARVYIPDRTLEGDGPNPVAIEALAREGAKLIITVDCGTTSIAALRVAGPLGSDVVVVDHHQADERLPDVAAVINPNRQDDLSGLGYLCAAGVTFMLLVATTRHLRMRGYYSAQIPPPDLLELLDLAALATVCDVVALRGLNRAFVTRGLQVMRQRGNAGLKALADAAGLAVAPTTYHLGFVLGPRINAGGRIGDAALGARLLATADEIEAARIAVLLDKLNRERKAVELQMLDEAVAFADNLVEADGDIPLLLVGSDSWHKGVVGLVASRLVDRFRRPSCAVAWDETGQGTGSLRSIDGVDIGAAVRAAVEAGHLIKGGGHAMAAGLTVARAQLSALETFLRQRILARRLPSLRRGPRYRRRIDPGQRNRRACEPYRSRWAVRSGQSAAAICLSRPSHQVCQDCRRCARALRSRSWRWVPAGRDRLPCVRPADWHSATFSRRHADAYRRASAP